MIYIVLDFEVDKKYLNFVKANRDIIIKADKIRQSNQFIRAMNYFRSLKCNQVLKEVPCLENYYSVNLNKYYLNNNQVLHQHYTYLLSVRETLIKAHKMRSSKQWKSAINYFNNLYARNYLLYRCELKNNYRIILNPAYKMDEIVSKIDNNIIQQVISILEL